VVHPDYLLDQLTSKQLSEWEAYDKIDPIGSWRDDFRIARLESLLVNIVNKLYAKKGVTTKDVKPIDFMTEWYSEEEILVPSEQQVAEQIKQTFLNIAQNQKKKSTVRTTPPVIKNPVINNKKI